MYLIRKIHNCHIHVTFEVSYQIKDAYDPKKWKVSYDPDKRQAEYQKEKLNEHEGMFCEH